MEAGVPVHGGDIDETTLRRSQEQQQQTACVARRHAGPDASPSGTGEGER